MQDCTFALLMEMGTGKSLTSIAITGALAEAGCIRRVLVMAPLSIPGVWEEEFQKFADFPYALAVLSGADAKKLDPFVIMNGDLSTVEPFFLERNVFFRCFKIIDSNGS